MFLNGQLGQIPPVAQTSVSLCPARARRQLITPNMKRGGQKQAAEAKKEGRGDKADEDEGKGSSKRKLDGRKKNENSRKTNEDKKQRKAE